MEEKKFIKFTRKIKADKKDKKWKLNVYHCSFIRTRSRKVKLFVHILSIFGE